MNYELCKQLKDAGFPQKNIEGLRTVFSTEDGEFTKYPRYDKPYVYIPTLSELIEACGMPSVAGFVSCTNGEWYASLKTKNEYGMEYEGKGKTPEESVAKLWLKLKKKERI